MRGIHLIAQQSASKIKIHNYIKMKRKPDKSLTSFLYAIVGRSSGNFLFLTKER